MIVVSINLFRSDRSLNFKDVEVYMDEMVNAVVMYDISDNKRRNICAKLLNSYGTRVQYSVYEVFISPQKFEKLKNSLKIFCLDNESIIIYRLNSLCDKMTYGKEYAVEELAQNGIFL